MANDIFISHKSSEIDRNLAAAFKHCLTLSGIPMDSIFVAEELRAGEDWQPAILKALQESTIFYLLYTDPSYDWDWCLFEAGYWLGIRAQENQPTALICINAGVGRPSPLDRWQDIHKDSDFLSHLISLFDRDPPFGFLNGRRFQGSALSVISKFWEELALPQRKSGSPVPTLDERCTLSITVSSDDMVQITQGRDIPGKAQVEINAGAASIFPRARETRTWDEFVGGLDECQKPWTACLATLLRMLNGKNRESPFLPLVRAGIADTRGILPIYQPFVSIRLEHSDGGLTFQVEFVRRSDAVPVKDNLDRLYHYLILARNFRFNALERYRREFDSGAQLDKKISGFLDEIDLVNIDLGSRGLDTESDFGNLFSTETCNELSRLTEEWQDAEKELRRMYDKSDIDRSEVNVLMDKLLHINMVFALIVCSALQGSLCLKA